MFCNIQKYLPNQFTQIQMLFLGNARESSVPLFVPPKYPPSRMDYPLHANIPGHKTTQLPVGLMLIKN